MKFLHKFLWLRGPNTASSSSDIAKERLKVALTYDRSGLAQGTIEHLRDDIIQLIVKHLAIREADIQIKVDRTAEGDKLIASIPLKVTQRPPVKIASTQVANTTASKKTHSRRRRRRSRPRPRPAN